MGQMNPIRNGTKVILVVEDDALIGAMIADTLEEQGMTVFLVSSAEAALRHIETGGEVDALFTDIHLAGVMDGSELANRVRSLRPDMPIVYASGRWEPNDRDRLVSRSVFLPKPYDPYDAGTLLMRLVSN